MIAAWLKRKRLQRQIRAAKRDFDRLNDPAKAGWCRIDGKHAAMRGTDLCRWHAGVRP